MTNQIAEKIAKILAKAESTNSPEEAETFMMKVHAMLELHGLEMDDIATLNRDDPVGVTRNAHGHYAADNWVKNLAFAAARYFGCNGVVSHEGRNRRWMTVGGRESARITFQLMMPYIVSQVRREGRVAHKAGLFRSESQARTKIGNALTFRLWKLIRDNEQSAPIRLGSDRANALVPVDAIKEALYEVFPNLKESKARSLSTTRAAVKIAGGISLHKQTTATKASHRIGA